MRYRTDWLASRARLTPSKLAIVEVSTGLRLTYQDFYMRVNRLAGYLKQTGINKGDRIALLAPNSVYYLELLFAAGTIGAIFVPLNYRFSTPELAYVISDCTPGLLVYHEDFANTIAKVKRVIELPPLVDLYTYEAVVGDSELIADEEKVKMEDPWAIVYTGGTTGRPKGAILSHRAITWNSINTIVSWGLTDNEITPVYLPMFHTGGLNALTTPVLHAGGTVIIGKEFNAPSIFQVLADECCTIALFVPTMYHLLIHSAEFADVQLPSMHTFLSGGAPCPHTIYEALHKKGWTFKEGYGLTEAGPNNFYIHPKDAQRKVGSLGVPMFHNNIRVVNENGDEVADGEPGEIWIEGPHLFSGYWNKPKETAEALVDGWLRTGDLARKDAEGYHYIVGRKKDMIITGGENVYPLEVELVLDTHEAVSEVAVIGLPHEKWGEVVTAVIVPVNGYPLTGDILKAYCASRLANYKIPKNFIIVEEIPKTSVGKIDKKSLIQELSEGA